MVYGFSIYDVLDNKWNTQDDAVQYSFISRLVVKKKAYGKLAVDYEAQMLDLVEVKICPEEIFILYYITAKLVERSFE